MAETERILHVGIVKKYTIQYIYEIKKFDEFVCKPSHKLQDLVSGLYYTYKSLVCSSKSNQGSLIIFMCMLCNIHFTVAVLSHCLNQCVDLVISNNTFHFIKFCVIKLFHSIFYFYYFVSHPVFVCFSFLQAMFISLSLKSGLVLLVLLEQDK